MQYKVDFDINQFQFWSGAKDRVEGLDSDTLERLGQHIEEVFGFDEELPTDTAINDYVWFEWDSICEAIGIDDDGNPVGSEEWVKRAIYKKYDWDEETAHKHAEDFMKVVDCENMEDTDELIDAFEEWYTDERIRDIISEHFQQGKSLFAFDDFFEDSDYIGMDYTDEDIIKQYTEWIHKKNGEEGYTYAMQNGLEKHADDIAKIAENVSDFLYIDDPWLYKITRKWCDDNNIDWDE